MASKHTRLHLLDEFTCTGSECPASCCSYGWNIDIDDETYIKWQQADLEQNKLGLLESLITKDGSNERYLKHVNNQCIHLSDEGLCSLQVKFGHEFIPKTCQKYPRNFWSTGKYSVESLNLSCPEVLKLLLRESNDNLFENSKKAKTKNIECSKPTIPHELGSLLDDYIFQVMRYNKYSVSILLLTIAKKLIDIALLSRQEVWGIADLQKELINVSQQIKTTQNDVEKQQITSSLEDMGRFWYLVYQLGKMGNVLPSELDQYQDAIFDFIESSDKSDDSFKNIGKHIKSYRSEFYNNLPSFYQNFMCRYLRVKFINNAFPRSPVEGNLVAGFLYCVLPYALIQLYVWVAVKTKGSLSEQDVIEVMYSVERKLNHNEKIYKFLSEHTELLRIDTYYNCLADV